jgi:hypothetical protein
MRVLPPVDHGWPRRTLAAIRLPAPKRHHPRRGSPDVVYPHSSPLPAASPVTSTLPPLSVERPSIPRLCSTGTRHACFALLPARRLDFHRHLVNLSLNFVIPTGYTRTFPTVLPPAAQVIYKLSRQLSLQPCFSLLNVHRGGGARSHRINEFDSNMLSIRALTLIRSFGRSAKTHTPHLARPFRRVEAKV